MLIFPEADVDEILTKLERVRRNVASEPLKLSTGEEVSVTFSAGIASYPADGEAAADLIDAADQRLLRAKREGRNRIVKG